VHKKDGSEPSDLERNTRQPSDRSEVTRGLKFMNRMVEVLKGLTYQDIDVRDIGVLEVEKVGTFEVSK
jgi:hypothetical protein